MDEAPAAKFSVSGQAQIVIAIALNAWALRAPACS